MDHAFLTGKISSLCSKGGDSLFESLNKLYMACFWMFYDRTKRFCRKILQREVTIKEIQKALQRPAKLLEDFHKGMDDIKAKNDPTRLEFTDMSFGTAQGPAQSSRAAAPKPVSVPKRLQGYAMGEED